MLTVLSYPNLSLTSSSCVATYIRDQATTDESCRQRIAKEQVIEARDSQLGHGIYEIFFKDFVPKIFCDLFFLEYFGGCTKIFYN